jgi:tetratricopeptide (TPR) repeat protein
MLDNSQLEYARNAKESVAVLIRTGIEHFEGGRHAAARDVLLQARQLAPAEAIILYFLGLNALDQRQDDEALNFLKRYSQEDPAGARERKLGDVLALLTSSELRKEAKRAVDNEEALSSQPPEPNSIAVQPFVNQGDPTFAPLAKGIASMLIADLSKVPGLRVLEREKVQRIIDEAHLSESTLVDNKSAVRTGRIIRAEKVVVGKFGVQ